MTALQSCPASDVLQRFVLGRTSDEEADTVEQHVCACENCAERLSPPPPEDALSSALRLHHTFGPIATHEGRLPHLISHLKSLALTAARVLSVAAVDRTAAAHAQVMPAPASLGRYEILGTVGSGGMGTVYRARDGVLNREVAVKVPHLPLAPAEAETMRRRFLREARAAAAVRHPGVCPIHDVGESDGLPYVVMDLVDGESLAQRLKREPGPFEPRHAAMLVQRAATALQAIHDHGLIHRDLKPGNILLDAADEPILTDFGLVRLLGDAEQLTGTGVVVGTPAYVTPEDVDPRWGKSDTRGDVYSLGVVLYQLLTGRLPFDGTGPSLVRQIADGQAPSATLIRRDLDPRLSAIVSKAIATRPDDRYPTAQALATALSEWLDRGRSSKHPTRRRLLALAGGLVILLPAGLALWPRQSPATSTPTKPVSPPTEERTIPPTMTNLPAFKGAIDLRVYENRKPPLARGRIRDPNALPLRLYDCIRIDVRLNRKGFVYIFWIDGLGRTQPVYPWEKGKWELRPDVEEARMSFDLPEDELGTWQFKNPDEPSGMHTLLMLVRHDPLPRDFDMRGLFEGLPPQPAQSPYSAVWFENGKVVEDERMRGPNFFDVRLLDDPVLRTQKLLRQTLGKHFVYSRAVCFAYQGARPAKPTQSDER